MKATALPKAVELQLCTLIEEPFDDSNWLFEPKLDGLRVLCRIEEDGDIQIISRNGIPQNEQFPEVVAALAQAAPRAIQGPAILDGELVCLDPKTEEPSFEALQQRLHVQDPGEIARRKSAYPAAVYFFDMMYGEGRSITSLPLRERKDILKRSVRWNKTLRWTECVPESGISLFRKACRHRKEGIVGKRADRPYQGGRSKDWIKVKCLLRQEFVIAGYTEPTKSRKGIGALLVGYYSDDGRHLNYAGKVGTGFTREVLLDLRARLSGLERETSPFTGPTAVRAAGSGAHWVTPTLAAEIGFSEWTRHGILRHPRYAGLRVDKSGAAARTVRREQPQSKGPTGMPKLASYRKMRDFSRTKEPNGKTPGAKAKAKPDKSASIFVIQEHHATRLHYDFRLEVNGVLKSWAVTQVPVLDPRVKRLAIEVEDHPLDYARFEGTIPKGEYGGGKVKIWDHGTYENLQGSQSMEDAIASGHVKIRMKGEVLKGAFALIRMRGKAKKPQWLLIKARDQSRPGEAATTPDIQFTHTDKLLYPKNGISKGDVLAYYRSIAPKLLPFLKDRPVTLERAPDGIGKGSPVFWQKNTPRSYPGFIRRLKLAGVNGKSVDYAIVNDAKSLLYLVNQGTLTFHTFLSRQGSLDQPDYVLFDLDPGKAPFSTVIRAAKTLRKILKRHSREAFVKTSGKSGLHILVPWVPDRRVKQAGYDAARAWAVTIGEELVQALPDSTTLQRSKASRGGKLYVDVMQNVKGHHVVPPYVLRTTPEATISMPLSWTQLNAKLKPDQFTIKNLSRVAVSSIAWSDFPPAQAKSG